VNLPLFSFAQSIGSLWQAVKRWFRQWTKPINDTMVLSTALDLTRSRLELMLENALLRQQLIVLKRQTKCPKLTWRSRRGMLLTVRPGLTREDGPFWALAAQMYNGPFSRASLRWDLASKWLLTTC